ncbi:MAG: NfeD family protein [Acidimicrobiales bacterium]
MALAVSTAAAGSSASAAQQPGPAPAPDEPGPAAAQPPVDVIEVSGRIDGILANFIERSIATSVADGSQLLVIQLDSPGSVLSDRGMDELVAQIRGAAVPVGVWVGPSGSEAYNDALRLIRAAAVSGIANGAHIGRYRGRCPECRPDDPLLTGQRLSAGQARGQQAVDTVTPTLGDFVVEMDGRVVAGRTLETARVVTRDGQPRREPIAQVRFAKLNLVERVLHGTTNPSLAYLLVVIGLLLIVFEFYSVGIGVAGLTGGVCLALSAYGLGALGATPLGLVLVAVGVFGYAVDVQAGAPRAWTVIGTVALLFGSWFLFPGDRRVGWLVILAVVAGTVLFAVRGMLSMVRSRFSTPTIGRESMIGEPAEATTPIDPEGMVRLRGALWRARVNRATPIVAGEAVKVVAIDGLVLEVEADDRPTKDFHHGGG